MRRKIGMICMLHVLLLTAVSLIQTVVVTAREDAHCNYQYTLTAMKGIYAVWSRPPFAGKPIICFRNYGQMKIDNKECTITFTDSGFICSHMWKGTISRENFHLGIHIVNVENTVLSTSCRSYHEECIDLYIYTYHDLVESQCLPRKLRFGIPSPPTYLVKPDCSAHRVIYTLAVSRTLYSDKARIVSTSWYTKNWVCGRISWSATQFAFGMREKKSCAKSKDPNESAPLLSDEMCHQIWLNIFISEMFTYTTHTKVQQ